MCEVAKAMEWLRCPISAFLFPVFCFVAFFFFFPFKLQNNTTTHFLFSHPLLPSTVKHLQNHTNIISSSSSSYPSSYPSPYPSPPPSPPPSPSPSSLHLLSNFTPANQTTNNSTVLSSSTKVISSLKRVSCFFFLLLLFRICYRTYCLPFS